MIFQTNDWERAIAGVGSDLVRKLEIGSINLASHLSPASPDQDLETLAQDFQLLRGSIDEVRKRSSVAVFWPAESVSDPELTIWALGLSHHVCQ